MRPPHYAGENTYFAAAEDGADLASMRPPHYAGENKLPQRLVVQAAAASMRPPHYAGENWPFTFTPPAGGRRFNEAPALRGGKPHELGQFGAPHDASMRPPHYAGENMAGKGERAMEPIASMRPPHYAGENQ